MEDHQKTPTTESYDELQRAYDYYNKTLFNNELPPCLITFARIKSSYGYHARKRWSNRNGVLTDEVALNPTYFAQRPIAETLSTLVHEQCHLWQDEYGTPGRGRYHNNEWAEKMKSVGLSPFNIKNQNRETGDQVSHKIITGGAFDIATQKLISEDFKISWVDRIIDGVEKTLSVDEDGEFQITPGEPTTSKNTTNSGGKRTKYSCPNKHYSVWGKSGIDPKCGQCNEYLEPEDE